MLLKIIIPKNNIEDNSIKMTRISPIDGKATKDNSEELPKTLPDGLKDQNVIIVISNFSSTCTTFTYHI